MLFYGRIGCSWGHRTFFGSSRGKNVITLNKKAYESSWHNFSFEDSHARVTLENNFNLSSRATIFRLWREDIISLNNPKDKREEENQMCSRTSRQSIPYK
jgi:hypothetical protein